MYAPFIVYTSTRCVCFAYPLRDERSNFFFLSPLRFTNNDGGGGILEFSRLRVHKTNVINEKNADQSKRIRHVYSRADGGEWLYPVIPRSSL